MSHTFDQADLQAIAEIEAFRALSAEDIRKLARTGRFVEVARGTVLVRQGEPADVLYYVLNGRFSVEVEGRGAIGEIRRGEPIGEIAFFRGGLRTANVRSLRDSLVLAFDQNQMDELSRSAPRFARAIVTSLAERLGQATARLPENRGFRAPRTIAIHPAGDSPHDPDFARGFAAALKPFGKSVLVLAGDVPQRLCAPAAAGAHDVTGWVEAIEDECQFAVFDCGGLDPALRDNVLAAVDCVLFAADANAGTSPNAAEGRHAANAGAGAARLVLLHPAESAIHPGTSRWLAGRSGTSHFHVARGSAPDLARLARFITGNAIGFVASGGGAACAAHIGVYKAFRESGVDFDIFGGTSAGAAMAAAFAYGLAPDDIDACVEDIFVTRRAMGKLTIPRYSLFDHRPFDEALRAHYGETAIEDLHKPFFALSTNLSAGEEYVHREGPVWQAVRASGAIPGLLPPFYTAQGEMLVDGCLLDNVPLRVMQRFSAGPNVVSAFRLSNAAKFDVKYHELPGRWGIAAALSNPLSREALPNAPGIAEVLMRAITLSHDTELTGGAHDIFVLPPAGADTGIMSWDKHSELMESARIHTLRQIEALDAGDDAAFRALTKAGR